MTAQQRDMVHQILRNAPFDLGGDVAAQRPLLEQMLTAQPLPADVRMTTGELGGVPVIFIDIDGVQPRGTIFHTHGGGFAIGSARSSVGLASSLARKSGTRAVSVDYRLAPEYRYPAALQDVTAAYRALLEQAGGAERAVVSGESAGGNLAVELLIAGKSEGLTMPTAVVLFSPMTDLTVSGNSYAGKADVDPAISAQAIRTRVQDYLDGTGTPATDPLVSPIFADLTGLPPLLIQAGSHEVLLDDATSLAVKAAADDVAIVLDITPGVPHVFQAFAAALEERGRGPQPCSPLHQRQPRLTIGTAMRPPRRRFALETIRVFRSVAACPGLLRRDTARWRGCPVQPGRQCFLDAGGEQRDTPQRRHRPAEPLQPQPAVDGEPDQPARGGEEDQRERDLREHRRENARGERARPVIQGQIEPRVAQQQGARDDHEHDHYLALPPGGPRGRREPGELRYVQPHPDHRPVPDDEVPVQGRGEDRDPDGQDHADSRHRDQGQAPLACPPWVGARMGQLDSRQDPGQLPTVIGAQLAHFGFIHHTAILPS
jgi:epsilon-lactone hydrolase